MGIYLTNNGHILCKYCVKIVKNVVQILVEYCVNIRQILD